MTFDDLNLSKSLRSALKELGYEKPTTIQEKAFSVVMSGRDMVGIAQTGTGKTLAYLLPCLKQWTFSKDKNPTILIIVPTRELVAQVVEEVKALTMYMDVKVVGVYGGTNMNTQMAVLREGLDILVATPGRLLDLSLNGTVKLKLVKKFIIDEVDEMLNLGFRPQLVRVMDFLATNRQNLMFSATMTDEVSVLINDFFSTPQVIEAAPTGTPLDKIHQTAYNVPNFNTKINLVKMLLTNSTELTKVLIFMESKKLADHLFEQLEAEFPEKIGVIHSNKAQNNRFNTVNSFKDGNFRILIATDIIARGLDIAEVSHVINIDTPDVAENYMHRIGRTGRADQTGISITFTTEKEMEYRDAIETLMDRKIEVLPLPEGLVFSDILIDDEKPKVNMKIIQVKLPKRDAGGGAFHEKLDKNKKVNVRVSRSDKMKMKYKKPKTRGAKK
jgi:ATP-dependent RNA helicase RhlE